MGTNLSSDRNLTTGDIQQLADADAIVAFFASLGYGTDARLTQMPAAMGITAESLQRKIRRIERIADQEEGLLQVYLVELDSVTMEATRGLARALRDRTGNYLLVLTSDYELLDFVLLERQIALAPATALSVPRVSVRSHGGSSRAYSTAGQRYGRGSLFRSLHRREVAGRGFPTSLTTKPAERPTSRRPAWRTLWGTSAR